MLTDDPKKEGDKTTTPMISAGNLKSDAVEGIAQSAGELPQPPMNRRSTDPKTPPPALADTNVVEETKGLRALLHSLLSKIMPKKSD